MSRRSKDQLEQDRADVLAVLEEDGALTEWQLIARVLGYTSVADLHQAWPSAAIGHTLRDLSFLQRKGQIAKGWDQARVTWGWHLATDDDVNGDEDRREVHRLYASWQEADA